MKVVLDLDVLLSEQKITQNEYEKLALFASNATSSLAFNMLVSFGIVSVALGAIALMPSFITAIVIGVILMCGGTGLSFAPTKWHMLAKIVSVLGVLSFVAGLGGAEIPILSSVWLSGIILALAAIGLRNGFLMVLAVLAFFGALGSSTDYSYASYGLVVRQPLVVVVVFSIAAYLTYLVSKTVSIERSGLAIIASRTCVFLVNLGFWIGSLWGSDLTINHHHIAPIYFTLTWAFALLACSIWAWRQNKRWLLNCCCVFAAIHFYTQWFSVLSDSPLSLFISGCIAVALALAIRWVNETMA